MEHNPLDIIDRHFQVEFWNPNPKMAALASGDRFTMTFEVHKDLFDMFCEAGHDGRKGMIIQGMMMVTDRPNPVGYYVEGEISASPEPKPEVATVPAEPEKVKGGPKSIVAARLGQDEEFRDWVNKTYMHFPHQPREVDVKEYITGICGITSRRELDHNKDAADIFENKFRRPYVNRFGE